MHDTIFIFPVLCIYCFQYHPQIFLSLEEEEIWWCHLSWLMIHHFIYNLQYDIQIGCFERVPEKTILDIFPRSHFWKWRIFGSLVELGKGKSVLKIGCKHREERRTNLWIGKNKTLAQNHEEINKEFEISHNNDGWILAVEWK